MSGVRPTGRPHRPSLLQVSVGFLRPHFNKALQASSVDEQGEQSTLKQQLLRRRFCKIVCRKKPFSCMLLRIATAEASRRTVHGATPLLSATCCLCDEGTQGRLVRLRSILCCLRAVRHAAEFGCMVASPARPRATTGQAGKINVKGTSSEPVNWMRQWKMLGIFLGFGLL